MNISADSLPAGSLGGTQDEEENKRLAQEADTRKTMVATVLEPAARERLSRIAIVSPQRAQQIEAILVRMVGGGQLRNKVTEAQFIDLLDQLEGVQDPNKSGKSKIIYQRRKDFDDDFDI
ncbi:DNA-binding TFAR19-related protein [Coprinopsis marcescibilis]|uniref:DNA-binding TFAR19-related protein n=1 Tax=Coprinopsis marcescibilis TaxID=230819 RepID=A0A5C3LAW5_COPMA|nr:DNA-binding TFAR19-related protein [Coprinopsis marcescibilis]